MTATTYAPEDHAALLALLCAERDPRPPVYRARRRPTVRDPHQVPPTHYRQADR